MDMNGKSIYSVCKMNQFSPKYYIIFKKKFPFWKLSSKIISILETFTLNQPQKISILETFRIVRVFEHSKIYRKTINFTPKSRFVQKRAIRFGTVVQP